MSAPPNRTDLAGTPTVATYKIAIGLLYDYVASLLGNGTATIATNAEQVKAREYLGVGATGFKNRLVNPEFMVDQENAGVAVSIPAGPNKYIIDQWFASSTGATITAQQVTGISDRQNSLRFTGAASNTAFSFGQRIESTSCADLKNQTVTVSLKAKASSARTVIWTIYYASITDNFTNGVLVATGNFNLTTSVNSFNFTFNAGENAANGLSLKFDAISLLAGEVVEFDQVQLEKSSVPTEFQGRPEQQELALCQRHWLKLNYVINVASASYTMSFPVEMRTTPTVTGAGAGFTLQSPGPKAITAYQNSRALHELTFNARL